MAGNAVGPGLVIDFSRHMARILAIDEQAGMANVEPGVVLSVLLNTVELGPESVQPGESPLRRARSLSSRATASIASTRVAGLLLLEGFRSMRSVPREPRKGK